MGSLGHFIPTTWTITPFSNVALIEQRITRLDSFYVVNYAVRSHTFFFLYDLCLAYKTTEIAEAHYYRHINKRAKVLTLKGFTKIMAQ